MIFDYSEGWFGIKYLSHTFNGNEVETDKKLNEIHSWILTDLKNVKVKITIKKNVGYYNSTKIKYTFKFTSDADFVAFKMMWL